MKIYSTCGLPEALPGEEGMGDRGYQGGKQLLTPLKRFRGDPELTPEEVLWGKIHSSVRVTVERAFGRLKVFNCFSTPWRSRLWDHYPFFIFAANLLNLQLDIHPLVKKPHEWLNVHSPEEMQKLLEKKLAPLLLTQQAAEEGTEDKD